MVPVPFAPNEDEEEVEEPSVAAEPIEPVPSTSRNDRIAMYENAFLSNRPEPEPPRNLRQYLNALTEVHDSNNHVNNHERQINVNVDNETNKSKAKVEDTIAALPVEVLLVIFSYLDDISLCNSAEVCKQWRSIVEAHIPQSLWERYTKARWPLYHQITRATNWFKVSFNALFGNDFENNFPISLDLLIADVVMFLSNVCHSDDFTDSTSTRKSFSCYQTSW